MENDFCNHNLNNLSWLCYKHVDYAVREAVDLLDIELNLTRAASTDERNHISKQAETKRVRKHNNAKKPLFWRSFVYFRYRFIMKGACLEGKEVFLWTFIQGCWYRTLVDGKVYEKKNTYSTDKVKMVKYIYDNFGINDKCIDSSQLGGRVYFEFKVLCMGIRDYCAFMGERRAVA